MVDILISLFDPIIRRIPYTNYGLLNFTLFSVLIFVIFSYTKSTYRIARDSMSFKSSFYLPVIGASLFIILTFLSVQLIKLIGYLLLKEKLLIAGLVTFFILLLMVILENIAAS